MEGLSRLANMFRVRDLRNKIFFTLLVIFLYRLGSHLPVPGVSFERSSARSLWQEFAPPAEGEQFKFGTLVFFNNLHHVGIVADADGFFHASSHGVVYSRFDDYWTKRLNGFRRIPFAQAPALVASSGR